MKRAIKIVLKILLCLAIAAVVIFPAVLICCPSLLGPPEAPEEEITVTEAVTLPDGFYDEGEEWYYYENGSKSQKTGVIQGSVDEKTGRWQVVNGMVDFSAVSLKKTENGTWQYVKNGEVTEETSDSLAPILGEILNSISPEKEISVFGDYELSEKNQKLLQGEIDKVTAKGYKTGFVVMNLNSLEGFSFNADEKIYSASTIKGPYVVSLVKSDNKVLEKEKKRIDAILVRSSNSDYESLRDRYGDKCFTQFSAETGNDLAIDTTRDFQFLTPRRLAHLWVGNYLFFESCEAGKKLGKMFEKPQISPIHKVFSDEFKTRTKAGWITKNKTRVTNDAGIVYTENGDYLIAIMTTAPCDFSVVENMARAIENVIFQQK